MSSRRARAARSDPGRELAFLPLSARIAWSYLASLGALVVAAGAVVVGNASLGTAACRLGDSDANADCRLGWAVVVAIVGLALGWAVLGALLHLGWRYCVAATALAGIAISADRLDAWWWWVLAALVPFAAALVSHEWGDGKRAGRARDLGLAAVVVIAVAAIAWWLLR